jgi:hypothetical protein
LTVGLAENAALPASRRLHIYPNPGFVNTRIAYSQAKKEPLSIIVYNIKGEKVISLLQSCPAVGNYELLWDGNNEKQEKTAAGIYIMELKTPSYREHQKLLHMP